MSAGISAIIKEAATTTSEAVRGKLLDEVNLVDSIDYDEPDNCAHFNASIYGVFDGLADFIIEAKPLPQVDALVEGIQSVLAACHCHNPLLVQAVMARLNNDPTGAKTDAKKYGTE